MEEASCNNSDGDHWVTVFGFTVDQRDDILELFSLHGDVMAQRVYILFY